MAVAYLELSEDQVVENIRVRALYTHIHAAPKEH